MQSEKKKSMIKTKQSGTKSSTTQKLKCIGYSLGTEGMSSS